MKSIRLFDRRVGSVGASVALVLGILVPGLIPMSASAATLSSRSIAMSSSVADAAGAEYNINFTTTTTADEAFVVDFCTNSPFEKDTCTAPSGFSLSGATVTVPTNGIGTVTSTATSGNHLEITGTSTNSASTATVINVAGVHNPTATGVVYARIYSYPTATTGYTGTDGTTPGTYTDFGGVAVDYTEGIGVTAAVREKLIFCVSKADPTQLASCDETNSGVGITDPSLTLGQGSVGSQALDSGHVSTGTNYSQISTNASGGAVVNIKNSNSCGGLHRTSQTDTTNCEIAPAGITATAIAAGQALFGVQLGTPAGTTSNNSGTIAKDSNYSDADTTKFGMGYVAGNASGVSSTYGDPLYTTSGAPANNMTVPMTFGASVSNDTPAGIYTATINLIATGTF